MTSAIFTSIFLHNVIFFWQKYHVRSSAHKLGTVAMTSNKMMIAYYLTIFILFLFFPSFSQTSSPRYSSASISEAQVQVQEKVAGGKRGLRTQCFDESGFIASCSEELSDDPDDDGIVSQDEFAALLSSLQCSRSRNMNSDFEACANALSFYALPLILQLLFIQAVCSQQLEAPYTTNRKECLNSATKKRINGEAFGFVEIGDNDSQRKRDITRFCSSIYSDVIGAGYIKECIESNIMHSLASSSPSLVGTTFPSASPSVNTNTWEPPSRRTKNPTSPPRDSAIIEELAHSTTKTKSPSPSQGGTISSSSPSATGETSNKPSSSQLRSNGTLSASPTIKSSFKEPTGNPTSPIPSSSLEEMQFSPSFFQNGSSYPSFSPSNNRTSFIQLPNSVVKYSFVQSASPSKKTQPIPTPNLQPTRAGTQYPSSAPSHATTRNYSSAPSFFHKLSETAETLVKANMQASPYPSAVGSEPPSHITSSIPTISSNYDLHGITSIEPSCLTKSSFTSFCFMELLSDGDDDNVISQMDFAAFLHTLSCTFKEQPCTGTTPFYALPLVLQLNFVKSACSQQHEDQNNTVNTDCSENIIRNDDSSGDKIGLVVATDNTSKSADIVEEFCRSIYIDVMKEGYFKACFDSVDSGSPSSVPTVVPSMTSSLHHSNLTSRHPSPSPLSEAWLVSPTAVPARVMPGPGTVNNGTDCLTSINFTDLCFHELLSDSDGDNIASQAEFAMFLETLPCSIATKNSKETCSRASVRAPKFYALPLRLQYHFVESVCTQMRFENGSAEGYNCLEDVEARSINGKQFGFSLVQNGTISGNLPVKEFCHSIYMDVVNSGAYFNECAETEPVPTPSMLISLTPSDRGFYSESSTAPSKNSSSQPASRGISNMPTTTSFKHANIPTTEPSRLHSSTPTVYSSAVRSTRPSKRIQPSVTPTYFSSSRPSGSHTLEPSFSVSSAYSSTNPTFSVTYSPSRPVTYERSTMIPSDASTTRPVGSAMESNKEPSPFPTHYQSSEPTVNQLLGSTTSSTAPCCKTSSIPTQNPSLPSQKDLPPDTKFSSEAPSATPSGPISVAPVGNNNEDATVEKDTLLSQRALFAVLTSVAGLLTIYVFVALVVANQRKNKGGDQERGTLGHFPDIHQSSDSLDAVDEMESAHERNDDSTTTIHEVDSQGGMDDLSPRQTYVTY